MKSDANYELLVKTLVEVHSVIYARGLVLGSADYFKVRNLIVDALRATNETKRLRG